MGRDRPVDERPANPLATLALAFALAGVFTCGLTGPIALVMGFIARGQVIARDQRGGNEAMAAMIIGLIGTLVAVAVLAAVFQYSDECSPGGC